MLAILALLLATGIVLKSKNQDLEHSFESATGQAVTLVIFALVGFFVAVAWWLRHQAARDSQAIHALAEQFAGITRDPDSGPEGGATAALLLALDNAMQESRAAPVLGGAWSELHAALVKRGGTYFRNRDARDIFTTHAIDASIAATFRPVWVSVPYSFVHELPGFMVGLGMLGTFVGIAIGLGQLTETDHILEHVSGVISGLASAFWTSIVGLIASTITTWRNHKADTAIDFAIDHLNGVVDACIGRASSEFFLEQQSSEALKHGKELALIRAGQAQANTYLKGLANNLSESLSGVLGPLLREVATAVRDQMANTMQPIREALEQVKDGFQDTADGIADSLEGAVVRVNEHLVTATGHLDSMGARIGDQLMGAADLFHGRIAEAGAGLADHLDTAVVRAAEGFDRLSNRSLAAMTRMTAQMDESVGKMSGQLQDRFSEITAGVGDLTTQFEAAGATLGTHLAGATSAFHDGIAHASAALAESLDGSVKRTSAGIHRLGQETAATMSHMSRQVGESVTAMTAQIEAGLGESTKGMTDVMATMALSVAQLGRELQAGIGQATTAMLNAVQIATRDVAAELEKTLAPVLAVARENRQLLDALGAQVRTQRELVVEQAAVAQATIQTIRDLGPQLGQLATHGESIRGMLEKLERTNARLTALQAPLENVSAQLVSGLAAAGGKLEGTVTHLDRFMRDMDGWIDSTSRSIGKFGTDMHNTVVNTLANYDTSLNDAVRGLGATGADLVGMAEEVGGILARLDQIPKA